MEKRIVKKRTIEDYYNSLSSEDKKCEILQVIKSGVVSKDDKQRLLLYIDWYIKQQSNDDIITEWIRLKDKLKSTRARHTL